MRGTRLVCCLAILVLSGCTIPPVDNDTDHAVPATTLLHSGPVAPEEPLSSEVSIAANPNDPMHAVAAANSGEGFGVYVTRDGGANWTHHFFTGADADPNPAGAPRFVQLSDPVVVFDHEGTVYLAGLSYLPTSAIFVAVSKDGGDSFPKSHIVWESDLAARFNDKEWFGVNPITGSWYMTWQQEPLLDQLRSLEGPTGIDADVGDIVLSRSTDQGASWSLPVKVSEGLHSNGTQVGFTPRGRAVMAWVNYEGPTIDARFSDDDGETWSEIHRVADIHIVPPYDRFSRMHTLPGMATSPVSDAVHIVWHDRRDGDAGIYHVMSPDGGDTWYDDTPMRDPGADGPAMQLYPWVTVDAHDVGHISYYDTQADPEHPRFQYRYTTVVENRSGFVPTFQDQGNLSGDPWTVFVGPNGEQDEARQLGDYTGITTSGDRVYAAWADGSGESTRIHVATVQIAPFTQAR